MFFIHSFSQPIAYNPLERNSAFSKPVSPLWQQAAELLANRRPPSRDQRSRDRGNLALASFPRAAALWGQGWGSGPPYIMGLGPDICIRATSAIKAKLSSLHREATDVKMNGREIKHCVLCHRNGEGEEVFRSVRFRFLGRQCFCYRVINSTGHIKIWLC